MTLVEGQLVLEKFQSRAGEFLPLIAKFPTRKIVKDGNKGIFFFW